MGFCGSKRHALSVTRGALQNECFVDVLNIVPHAIFLLVGLFILIVWSKSLFYKTTTWVHFKGHNARWLCSLLLILFIGIEIAEGFMSDAKDPDTVNYHTFIPHLVSLTSTILSLIFYHNIEQWNSPRFLLILLAYWCSALPLKVLKGFALYKNNIHILHIRVWLTWIDVVLYFLLLVIELNVLRIQKYAFFKTPVPVSIPPELGNTRYVHKYVNFLSKVTFWWLNGFLIDGFKTHIEHEQLGKLPQCEHAEFHYKRLKSAFDKEVENRKRQGKEMTSLAFHKVYMITFWKNICFAGGLRLIADVIQFVGPWCVEHIINYAYIQTQSNSSHPMGSKNFSQSVTPYGIKSSSDIVSNLSISMTTTVAPDINMIDRYITVSEFFSNGFVLSILLFIVQVVQTTCLGYCIFLSIKTGISFKIAVQSMVFDKSMSLSGLVINSGKMTVGQIMNHMSTDSMYLMYLFFFIHFAWSAPLVVIIALALMYLKLGVSALIGGSVVIIAGPLQYLVGKGMSSMQKKVMVQADKRVKKCNEAIQGIKVIKLLAWEYVFRGEIEASRLKELKSMFMSNLFRTFFSFIMVAVPALGTMVTFILYPYIEDAPLDVGRALSTLALFNILTLPIALFTMFCQTMITANVSIKRLVPYFLAEETEGTGDKRKTLTHSIGIDTADTNDIKMDTIVEYRNGARKLSTNLRKDDDLASSQSSLGSNRSKSPCHSRQNSKASLLDFLDPNRRPSASSHSGTALTVSDGVKESGRRRHHSGVSTEDEEEVAEGLTLIEPRTVVEISDGNFSWELNSEERHLKDINVKIPTGKLTLIVGQVGSGKTSLISAMLGEMSTISGQVDITKGTKIAYVSQKPWLLNVSLKDNILFGEAYDYRRYTKVLQSCALQPDIAALPAGDLTEIGEKGINLSGGQKQRISIARALYSNADTVILDDPFSALDAHVGKHVFEDSIIKRLIKRKRSVILVTHQLQFISHSNHIIAMKDGAIQYQGKLSEVKKSEPELYDSWRKALREAKASESSSKEHVGDSFSIDGEPCSPDYSRQFSTQSSMSLGGLSLGRQISQLSNMEEEGQEFSEEDPLKQSDKKDGQLVSKEHQEKGAVSLKVYAMYAKACGSIFIFLVILLQFGYHFLLAWSNIVLSFWAEKSTEFQSHLKTHQNISLGVNTTLNETLVFDNSPYTRDYIILNMAGIVGAFLANLVLYLTTIKASRRLHYDLLDTLLHLPIRFFDTNPTGRIMNRFSSDMSQIDQRLPMIIESFSRCVFLTLSALVMNAIGTPFFIIAAVPMTILYYLLQYFFRVSGRELQRIDNVTKSPVFSHLSETLNGLQTIRAFKAEKRFRNKAFSLINDNTTPFIFLQVINRWLGIRLDFMGSLLVFVAAIASLTACLHGYTTPAYVGLCITYALIVSLYLNWIVRNSAEAEMMMSSVERVNEYINKEWEPDTIDHHKGSHTVEKTWPEHGKIEFKNVSLKYDKDLEKVVFDVSFVINAGESIGICGRTGSGKSSLTLSLFRMIDICEGEILIDDKNTQRVPLESLRSKLAIIPQDPVLFTGTVRYNLDPNGKISDDRLWAALETVQLKETITELPDQLDSPITEGGENFSIGQKQLFCLARAFLRDNKILVLDEATASIDLETDNKLQRVISSAFCNKTVITIAHRISTILKYDRVMVLDKGKIVEFDSPKDLLSDPDSLFTSLVRNTKK